MHYNTEYALKQTMMGHMRNDQGVSKRYEDGMNAVC